MYDFPMPMQKAAFSHWYAELRKFVDGDEDPRAYAVSYIGWSFNEKCV